MEELRLGDQLIRYDREATVAAYQLLSSGCTDKCRCDGCRNFALQRETAYPPAFRAILDQMGIDQKKEDDVHESGIVVDGMCPYGGWLLFVGEIIEAGESVAAVAKDFQCFFRPARGPAYFGDCVLAIEFITKIRWLLADDPTA
jgi:hypothetical protein